MSCCLAPAAAQSSRPGAIFCRTVSGLPVVRPVHISSCSTRVRRVHPPGLPGRCCWWLGRQAQHRTGCAATGRHEAAHSTSLTALLSPHGVAAYVLGVQPGGTAGGGRQVEQLLQLLQEEWQQQLLLLVDASAAPTGSTRVPQQPPQQQQQQQQRQQQPDDLLQLCQQYCKAYGAQLRLLQPLQLQGNPLTTPGTAGNNADLSSKGSKLRELLASGARLAQRTATAAAAAADAVAHAAAEAQAAQQVEGVDQAADLPDVKLRMRSGIWDPEQAAATWQAAVTFCGFIKQLRSQGIEIELVAEDPLDSSSRITSREGAAYTAFELVRLLLRSASDAVGDSDYSMSEQEQQEWLAVLVSAAEPQAVVEALEEMLAERFEARDRLQDAGLEPVDEPLLPSPLDVVNRLDAADARSSYEAGTSGASAPGGDSSSSSSANGTSAEQQQQPEESVDSETSGSRTNSSSSRDSVEGQQQQSEEAAASEESAADAAAGGAAQQQPKLQGAGGGMQQGSRDTRRDSSSSQLNADAGPATGSSSSSSQDLSASDAIVGPGSSRQLIEAMMQLERSWRKGGTSDITGSSSSSSGSKRSTSSSSTGDAGPPVPELLPRPVWPGQQPGSSASGQSADSSSPREQSTTASAPGSDSTEQPPSRIRRIIPRRPIAGPPAAAAPAAASATESNASAGGAAAAEAAAAAGTDPADARTEQQRALQKSSSGEDHNSSASPAAAGAEQPSPSASMPADEGGSKAAGKVQTDAGDADSRQALTSDAVDGPDDSATGRPAQAAGGPSADSDSDSSMDEDDVEEIDFELYVKREFARFEEYLASTGVQLSKAAMLEAFVEMFGRDAADDADSGADEDVFGGPPGGRLSRSDDAVSTEMLANILAAILSDEGDTSSSPNGSSRDSSSSSTRTHPPEGSKGPGKSQRQSGPRPGPSSSLPASARGTGSSSSGGGSSSSAGGVGWEQVRKQFGQDGVERLQEILRGDGIWMTGWDTADMDALTSAFSRLFQGERLATNELRAFARMLAEAESVPQSSAADSSARREQPRRRQGQTTHRRASSTARVSGFNTSAKDQPYKQDTSRVRLPRPFRARRRERVQQQLRQLRQQQQLRRLVLQQRAAQLQQWRLLRELDQQHQQDQQQQPAGDFQQPQEQQQLPGGAGALLQQQVGRRVEAAQVSSGSPGLEASSPGSLWDLALRGFKAAWQQQEQQQAAAAGRDAPGVIHPAQGSAHAAAVVQQLQALLQAPALGDGDAGAGCVVVLVVPAAQVGQIQQAWDLQQPSSS